MPKTPNILEAISHAGLVGRGGAAYPTAKKWTAVKEALKSRKIGYIVVNGAEGEPGVKKDGYILKNHPAELIDGVFWADKFLSTAKIKKIYFFLNQEHFRAYAPGLKKILATKKYVALGTKVEFIIKPADLTYISGEESALLNLIEGRKIEPRLRPPYPTTRGLHGHPTLINNTETFYDVSLVGSGRYQGRRLYTIKGAVAHPGVYRLPATLSIEEVLRRTNNYPTRKFFVQVGGEASGELFNSRQLDAPVEGAGLIMVYDEEKTDKDKLFKYWLKFYYNQSCGQCTICREGTYRLWEQVSSKKPDYKLIREIVSALEESSFCALGFSLPVPLKSYWQNILKINL